MKKSDSQGAYFILREEFVSNIFGFNNRDIYLLK